MKRLSLRTAILGLLVTAGSSVVGVGLGTVLNKTVFARVPAPAQADAGVDTPGDFVVSPNRSALTTGLGRAAGLRVITLNPKDLPNHEFDPP